MEGLRDRQAQEGQQWGGNELKGIKKPLGKKTPFIGSPQIQPLPVQDAHKRYYRSCERYYRSGGSNSKTAGNQHGTGAVVPH